MIALNLDWSIAIILHKEGEAAAFQKQPDIKSII